MMNLFISSSNWYTLETYVTQLYWSFEQSVQKEIIAGYNMGVFGSPRFYFPFFYWKALKTIKTNPYHIPLLSQVVLVHGLNIFSCNFFTHFLL